MDTKFSVALHILVMIAESDRTLSSKDLAISVGTNASYIRKIISLLKNDIKANQAIFSSSPQTSFHCLTSI